MHTTQLISAVTHGSGNRGTPPAPMQRLVEVAKILCVSVKAETLTTRLEELEKVVGRSVAEDQTLIQRVASLEGAVGITRG